MVCRYWGCNSSSHNIPNSPHIMHLPRSFALCCLFCFGALGLVRATPPDFGPNVMIFDPSMPTSQIQMTVDAIANQQISNQFGTQRFAFLFKPGSYNVDAQLGYYTSLAGLGLSPDDVTIIGEVRVEGQQQPDGSVTALTNFWRSAENLSVNPVAPSYYGGAAIDQWAVSQAAPLRRVHIRGALFLFPHQGGFTSGGFIADSLIGRSPRAQWPRGERFATAVADAEQCYRHLVQRGLEPGFLRRRERPSPEFPANRS